jgi:hypothetical protein
MQVDFINVGASSKCWIAELAKLDHDLFYDEVARSGALMSKNIEFSVDDNGEHGQIIVGGVRVVGKFLAKSQN